MSSTTIFVIILFSFVGLGYFFAYRSEWKRDKKGFNSVVKWALIIVLGAIISRLAFSLIW
jgi:hypothetical protein